MGRLVLGKDRVMRRKVPQGLAVHNFLEMSKARGAGFDAKKIREPEKTDIHLLPPSTKRRSLKDSCCSSG